MCRRARRCGSGRLAKAGQPRLLGTLKLEAGAGAAQVMVDGTEVNLTHLDKRYFPDGATKRDLLDYNHDVAEFLVPMRGLRGKSGHRRAGWSSDRPGETRGKVPQK